MTKSSLTMPLISEKGSDMPETVSLTQNDEQRIRELLVGRRIVEVEKGSFALPKDASHWSSTRAEGRCVLDDGTQVLVLPNEGCGGCTSGWYHLEHLATVDNAITDVRLATESHPDATIEPQSYRIYVLADAVEINAIQVDGDDGNGYYGSGYELFIIAPEEAPADASLSGKDTDIPLSALTLKPFGLTPGLGGWSDGEVHSIGGAEVTIPLPEREDVAKVLYHGDTGDGWDGHEAVVLKLNDGRLMAWETSWGPTGHGFAEDAYGGNAEVWFAPQDRLNELILQALTDRGREMCGLPREGFYTAPSERDARGVGNGPVASRFVLVHDINGEEGYCTSWETWADCEAAFPLAADFRLIDQETGREWVAGAAYDWEAART